MGLRIDPNARFEREKTRAKQEVNADVQRRQEALKRRFAAQGLTASGEAIKAEQQVEEAGTGALSRRLQDISTLQEQDVLRRQEIEQARQFQTAEREASQKFAAGESAKARALQSSQFEKQFSAAQEQFNKQFGLQQQQFDLNKLNQEETIKIAREQADLALKQFDFNQKTEAFNAIQSIANQDLSEDQIAALVGVLGPDIMGLFKGDISKLFGSKTPAQSSVSTSKPPSGLPPGGQYAKQGNTNFYIVNGTRYVQGSDGIWKKQ